ncbi:hypothetical protein ABT282_07380 [Streptomyces sp. NPDC000927]|uniref:hypothetical protein n=1 Tax=Streptomyces sp. NPDC000927 TaxID=3154371 RepID=UPI00332A0E51
MKHICLYALEDGEEWLWRVSRRDASDLFGSPGADAPDVMWDLDRKVSDALSEARENFLARLIERDRICVGRHYVVPGSLCEGARARAEEADPIVREITDLTWDAPVLDQDLYSYIRVRLGRAAGQDGRDDQKVIDNFLDANRGRRVVPVWT